MTNEKYTDEAFTVILLKFADDKINPTLNGGKGDGNFSPTCAYVAPEGIDQDGENVAPNCVAGRFFREIGVSNRRLAQQEMTTARDVVNTLRLPLTPQQADALYFAQRAADTGSTHAAAIESGLVRLRAYPSDVTA
jgi:hypothetical protein